jgi:nicotinamide mononucleotide transporter
MGLNVYYLVISVYGWIHWSKGSNQENKAELPISRVTVKSAMWFLFWTVVFFIVISFILKDFTDSPVPFWDAFTTAASIVATYMLAQKIMEHWLIWIVVDSVSAGLYIYKGLYPTVLLFIVYTALAITGYFEWKRQWKREIAEV